MLSRPALNTVYPIFARRLKLTKGLLNFGETVRTYVAVVETAEMQPACYLLNFKEVIQEYKGVSATLRRP